MLKVAFPRKIFLRNNYRKTSLDNKKLKFFMLQDKTFETLFTYFLLSKLDFLMSKLMLLFYLTELLLCSLTGSWMEIAK